MASKIKVDQLEGSTGSTITVPTGQTFTVTDGIPVASGGTGIASFTAGDILYATGATTLTKLGKGTAEQVLAMNTVATAPDWGSVDLTVLPTITVAKGGTNLASFTAGDIMYATGSTTLAKLTAAGHGSKTLQMNSGATAPEWVTVAAASADYVKIASSEIDSGNPAYIDFQGCFTSTYRMYELRWSGITLVSAHYPEITYLKASDDSVLTGTYYSKAVQLTSALDGNAVSSWSQDDSDGFRPTNTWNWGSNDTVYNIGQMQFHDPLDTGFNKYVTFDSTFMDGAQPSAGTQGRNWGMGGIEDSTSTSGIRFAASGGDYENDTKAVVAIYGIKS